MPVEPGTQLLHYRIVGKIGEGGMGEVWSAHDTTLDRDIAIKILPPAFGSDADRLGRFEREAKMLASLNHPNIAGIYGLHADAGLRFLAMELVPGEDLARRLGRGPMPVDEALTLGRQIAEALEYAHERGIVHRDLKPANVVTTADGTVKVLDFGLAKAMAGEEDDGSPSGPAASMATMTSPALTQAGVILGTAAYMSPEQARGRKIDRRADIWAFGCVMYEMLSGQKPFEGETVTDVIAAIVTRQPDLGRLPAAVPPLVRRLLERCLDKDQRTRLRDIGEARILLANPGSPEPTVPAAVTAGPAPANRLQWAAGIVVAVGLGAALGRYGLAPASPAPPTYEFDVQVPNHNIEMGSFAISPDGRHIALAVRDSAGMRRLAVRDMDTSSARVLASTEGATYPFWSPDSREVAFFTATELKRIALDGAVARPITAVIEPRGGTWAPGDIILIGSGAGPITRVAASGGKPPEPITKVETPIEDGHCWPVMLPDGRHYVFLSDAPADEGHRIYLGSLDGGAPVKLRQNVHSQPVLDPNGRLLLGERGQLLAYPFDLRAGTLGDDATLVASQIVPLGNQHELPASVAVNGTIAFQSMSTDSTLTMVDADGRVMKSLAPAERHGNPTVSPDGKRAAFEIYTDGGEQLMWMLDLERAVRTPLSVRGKHADSSAWSPDGQTVYFDSDTSDKWEAYRKTVTGGGEPERLGLPEGAIEVFVVDVSPDGQWLLGGARYSGRQFDLYLLSLTGERHWQQWLGGPSQEDGGAFSPDSKWIAYVSDASGVAEVYMAPVEGGPEVGRWPISAGGGTEPKFSPDGRTLYYRSPAFDIVAVPIRTAGGTVEAGLPKTLFRIPQLEIPWLRNLFDVLPDGSGFLILQPASEATRSIKIRTGARD